MGFNSKHEFTPPTTLLGLLLRPCTCGIFSQPLQCLPSYWGFYDFEHGISYNDLNPCISSYLEKHWIPSWWHQILMNNKNLCKMSASWHWTPSSPKPYILNFPHCHFGAVSQSYLKCYLPSCSPHLTPNKKLNSQPSSCTSFFFFSRHCYAHFFKIHCVEICFNYFLVYIYD